MVAPLLLIINHLPQMLQLFNLMGVRQNVSRETFTNLQNDIQSKINYVTVLVAFD